MDIVQNSRHLQNVSAFLEVLIRQEVREAEEERKKGDNKALAVSKRSSLYRTNAQQLIRGEERLYNLSEHPIYRRLEM